MKHIGTFLFGLLLVAVGAVGGYLAHTSGGAAAAEDPAADEHDDHDDLDEATLANLGVEVGTLEVGRHVVTRSVHGVIVDPGLGRRPVVAPFAGVVLDTDVRPGQVVGAGEVLLRVLRDDLPAPELKSTAEMLAPLDEGLHEQYLALRSALRSRELAAEEVARLDGLAGDGSAPLVSAEQRVMAGQVLARAEQEVRNRRGELHIHGFDEAAIDGIGNGDHPVRTQEVRIQALRLHGMWSADVAEVFEALPEEVQRQPWTVAALGELQAAGLWTRAVREGFAAEARLRSRFREAVSLMLAGASIERVRELAAHGALEPVVELRAPAGAADWDVTELVVRPGSRVAAGEVLVRLDRPAEVWLRVEPLGDEIPMLQAALEAGTELRGAPLVAGAGPALSGLKLQRLAVEAADGQHGRPRTVAYVVCTSEPLVGGDGGRSWALRAGTRYKLLLPTETFEGVFVLPRGAVTSRGPDRIAFQAHPGHFHEYPVRVLHEDTDVVVLQVEGSALEAGDDVVLRGAFALAQAMQLEGGGGHSHPH